jgi:LemA protein
MTAIYVALGILVLLGVWLVVVYKRLVGSRNKVRKGWSGIDVQLRRRHDLVPNLVETVRRYADHERSTLQELTAARAAAVLASDPATVEGAESRLTNALGQVSVLAGAYPELRAAEGFRVLQAELANIEDDLQAARRIYNSNVREYNTRTQRWPTLLVARPLSFEPGRHFEFEGAAGRLVEEVEEERSRVAQ